MKSSSKQVSAPFVSFLTRYFLLRPPAQDTNEYDMIGLIIAVYIHFIKNGFIPYVLPTIFVYTALML